METLTNILAATKQSKWASETPHDGFDGGMAVNLHSYLYEAMPPQEPMDSEIEALATEIFAAYHNGFFENLGDDYDNDDIYAEYCDAIETALINGYCPDDALLDHIVS